MAKVVHSEPAESFWWDYRIIAAESATFHELDEEDDSGLEIVLLEDCDGRVWNTNEDLPIRADD